ncbi:hypothetical protein K440DRAFT_614133 [Wilcoxina mikolae CBS 423.85]|nr:hypothetical protein K440DRAFT_614133 [Wilcoxina mikolae CBS 423.85]
MLEEAVIVIDSIVEVDLKGHAYMLQNFLDFTFRLCGSLPTGNIDTANRVLLSLIKASPRVKEYLRTHFANDEYASEIFAIWHRWLLHHGNKHTEELLENAADVDPNLIYYQRMRYATLMLTGPEKITTLQHHINKAATTDRTALNWQLHWLSGFRGDTRYMALFLDEGADVNYVHKDANPSWPRTPLGHAVLKGRYENVQFLLDRGADVLVDTERCLLSALPRGWGEGKGLHQHQRDSYAKLTRILEEREREEMAKRGLQMPQATASAPSLNAAGRVYITRDVSKTNWDHVILAVGIVLSALVAAVRLLLYSRDCIWDYILCGVVWGLCNRRLIWWASWECYRAGWLFFFLLVENFGWMFFGAAVTEFWQRR